MIKFLFIFSILYFVNFDLFAENTGSVTGFNIPRFVSLKSNDVNLRVGSSINYPIILKYTKKNLPVEIIDEYGSWRNIIDFHNNTGWIHKSLLKGDRYSIIYNINQQHVKLYSKPNGKTIGEIGGKNIVKIKICLIDWCKIHHSKINAWIKKDYLWGVYKNEKINIPFYQSIINQFWKINFQ